MLSPSAVDHLQGLGNSRTELLTQVLAALEQALVAELTACHCNKRLTGSLCTSAGSKLVNSKLLLSTLGGLDPLPARSHLVHMAPSCSPSWKAH